MGFGRPATPKKLDAPVVPQPAQTQEEFYNALEVDVLARTIFGEARGEPHEGLIAVACVVLNRVKVAQKRGGKYWWGHDIITVCQNHINFHAGTEATPAING